MQSVTTSVPRPGRDPRAPVVINSYSQCMPRQDRHSALLPNRVNGEEGGFRMRLETEGKGEIRKKNMHKKIELLYHANKEGSAIESQFS